MSNKMKNNINDMKNNQNNNDAQTPEVVDSEIEKVFVEDPLFRFIKKWQKVIIWCVVIVAGVYFASEKFANIRENSHREMAYTFSKLRSQYANVITLNKDIKEKQVQIDKYKKENEGKKKEAEAKEKDLNDLKKQLTESYKIADEFIKILSNDNNYKLVTNLYSALLDKSKNNIESFKAKMGKLDWQSFDTEKDDKLRFYKELSAVIMAKYYFENGTQEGESKDLLTKISKNGMYFNVVAFKVLESLSNGDGVKGLDMLRESMIAKYPSQVQLLKQ